MMKAIITALVVCFLNSTLAMASTQKIPAFSIEIKMVDFDYYEKIKINKTARLIKKVLMSREFKQEILNHKYKGRKSFANNRGLTNLQIYNRILQGSERHAPAKDFEMDVTLIAYYGDNITVGYTFSDSYKIWMNRTFFSQHEPYQVTTSIVHEWLHKLGFDHDDEVTERRRYSVPYAIGYIVRRLAKDL